MVLVDADHGAFHSQVIIERAIHDWVDFLASELALDLRQEVDTWLPRKGPDYVMKEGSPNPTVPLGSVIEFEFPAEIADRLVNDMKDRVDRT